MLLGLTTQRLAAFHCFFRANSDTKKHAPDQIEKKFVWAFCEDLKEKIVDSVFILCRYIQSRSALKVEVSGWINITCNKH